MNRKMRFVRLLLYFVVVVMLIFMHVLDSGKWLSGDMLNFYLMLIFISVITTFFMIIGFHVNAHLRGLT